MRFFFFNLSSVQFVLFHTFHYTGSFTRNPLKAYYNSHIFGRNYTLTPLPPEKTKKKKKGEKKKKKREIEATKTTNPQRRSDFLPAVSNPINRPIGGFSPKSPKSLPSYRESRDSSVIISSKELFTPPAGVTSPVFLGGPSRKHPKAVEKTTSSGSCQFFQRKTRAERHKHTICSGNAKKMWYPIIDGRKKKKYIYIYSGFHVSQLFLLRS